MKTAATTALPAMASSMPREVRAGSPRPASDRGPAPSTESMRDAARAVAAAAGANVDMEVRAENGRFVLRVLDKTTGELINQFPFVDAHALAARLDDPKGLLFDATTA